MQWWRQVSMWQRMALRWVVTDRELRGLAEHRKPDWAVAPGGMT